MSIVVRHAKWGIAVACAYEVAAIAAGRTPTISDLCDRYRWLAPAVLAALAAHLYWHPTRKASSCLSDCSLSSPARSGWRPR